MSIKLVDKFLLDYVTDTELEKMQKKADEAFSLVKHANGPGSDFLGWSTLPVDYDKEEFARIKIAAERLRRCCNDGCSEEKSIQSTQR